MKTFPHFFRSPEELSSERARRRDVREMSFVTGNIVIGGGVDGDRHRNGWICRAARRGGAGIKTKERDHQSRQHGMGRGEDGGGGGGGKRDPL